MDIYNKINNIIEKINLNNINIDLIKKNINFLYTHFYIPFNNIHIKNNTKPILLQNNTNNYRNILNQILSSHLYREYISKINKIKNPLIYNLKYKNLEFYYIKTNDNDNEIAIKLFNICCLMYENYNKNKKYNIIWIPIDVKRDINKVFGAFTTSGITYPQDDTTINVIVSRYEEIEKLLIHELIHAFKLDGSHLHNDKDFCCIKKEYNKIKPKIYNYEYSIYESWTELMASYIFLVLKFYKLDKKIFKEKMLCNIIFEIIYSYNIVYNLFDIHNTDKIDDCNKKISLYEYYYIKAFAYNNYLLQDINDHNNKYLQINNMIKNIQNQDKFFIEMKKHWFKVDNFRYML